MTASEDFWQGYACAMEEIEHRLKANHRPEDEDLLDYVQGEIATADKKIQDLRRIQ